MYNHAKFGIASHFLYSKGKQAKLPSKDQEAYTESLQVLQKELAEHEREKTPLELFSDRIFVFTPEGQVIDLPRGSNAIDFAYAVHSDLGDRCTGVKINGIIRPILTELESGDVVSVMTSAHGTGPKLQWLSHVLTAKAKSKIRSFLRNKDHSVNLKSGKDLFEQECRRLHKKLTKQELSSLASEFGYDAIDDLFVALGGGEVTLMHVMKKVSPEEEFQKVSPVSGKTSKKKPTSSSSSQDIIIEDDPKMGYMLAQCCSPQRQDEIVAYITLKEGIRIHTINCPMLSVKDPTRMLSAWWKGSSLPGGYLVHCEILVYDRRGILQEVLALFSDPSYELRNIDMEKNGDEALLTVEVLVRSYPKVFLLFDALEDVPGVKEVRKV